MVARVRVRVRARVRVRGGNAHEARRGSRRLDSATLEPGAEVAGELLQSVGGEAARPRVGLAVLEAHLEREVEERHPVLHRVGVEGMAIVRMRPAVRLRQG